MFGTVEHSLVQELDQIRQAGLYKEERIIQSAQGARIKVSKSQEVLNFCANNYLGLANHPALIEAVKQSLDQWGYGLSSVRFICGTQAIHRQLEQALSDFLGTRDTILYSSCFDANGGLFETLLTVDDAVISDSLNHASIIDGIRLCKAKRYRYKNRDMADLEAQLKQTQSVRRRLIATDGVFSMDGTIATLAEICTLAEKYDAMVMVDDSHSVGVLGTHGRGTHEYADVMGRVDIITGTLGKALGGASGGYTSGRKEIIELLRQRSRPYLFSNTLAPSIVAASLAVLNLVTESTEFRDRLHDNTQYFRKGMSEQGFDIQAGDHPIVPIMLGDAVLAHTMADQLLTDGIYVIGFSFPVVPRDAARIRVQISAAHTRADLDFAIEKMAAAKKRLGV
ncbi:MAG: glycine C-acetyltransferase [Planctomycetes bacterium]|nr:glycine C-acetyltransferase [Planctomycetota bacterium]